MSAAVKAVKSVAKAAVKTVESVGRAVEKVAEVVVDTARYVAKNPEIVAIVIAAPYATAAVGTAVGASATAVTLATPAVTAAAITASQGGNLEDIGKSALAAFVGTPLGQYAGTQVATATGAKSALQVGLSNAVGGAVGSAGGALVLGEDVGKSAVMGAAGSLGASLARSGASELGVNKYGAAGGAIADVGEAVGRTAAGGNLEQELISAGIGTLAREGKIALEELTAPTTAYFPKISPDTAALIGSTIEGEPVTDVATGEGAEGQPRLFPKGLMVYDPQTSVSEIYAVSNKQGEVFEARNIIYPNGTVQRIIYDPNTDTYQQQILKQAKTLPGVDVQAGPDNLPFGADTIRRELARRQRVKETGTSAVGGAQGAAEPGAPTGGGGAPTAGDQGQGRGGLIDEGGGGAGGTEPTATGDGTLSETALAGGGRGTTTEGGRTSGKGGVGEGEGGGGDGEGDGALTEAPTPIEELTDAELLQELERLVSEETPEPEGLLDVRTAIVRRPRTKVGIRGGITVSPRATGQGAAAIVGDKEPIFGGEPDQQQEVWNERSLRLRKALGL